MIVCGLDLSLTNAGIAVLTDGRPTLLRSVGHGGHNGASYPNRSARITSQCTAVLEVMGRSKWPVSGGKPDLAVIEGPSYASKFGDLFDRGALWWGIYAALVARGMRIPVAVVPPKTLKLWATGRGDADKGVRGKPMMRAAVTSWYPKAPILDDDQADALALACVGAFHLGEPMPFEVKARHETALEKVEWPSRDETNNPVVSQTDEAHPKTAQNRARKAGIAIP